MKAFPILIAAALLGVAPLAGQLPKGTSRPPMTANAAIAVVDAFHAALGRGDTASAASLLAIDALIYESGRAERSRAEYGSHHLPADAVFAKATRRSVTRRSSHFDNGLAWVATEATTKGTYKDRPIDSIGLETMILRQTSGGWRITHIHWSSANSN